MDIRFVLAVHTLIMTKNHGQGQGCYMLREIGGGWPGMGLSKNTFISARVVGSGTLFLGGTLETMTTVCRFSGEEMYLKQQRATKAPIVAFYKLHKPGIVMSIILYVLLVIIYLLFMVAVFEVLENEPTRKRSWMTLFFPLILVKYIVYGVATGTYQHVWPIFRGLFGKEK